MPYQEAKIYVNKLKLSSQNEWREYAKSEKKPNNIPSKPSDVYADEFEGFGKWLGQTESQIKKKETNFLFPTKRQSNI